MTGGDGDGGGDGVPRPLAGGGGQLAMCLNCALGAKDVVPYIENLSTA